MKRWTYFIEDLETRCTQSAKSITDAKALAKATSLKTGHVVAVVAADNVDKVLHPQGAYYGRSWRQGGYHYTPRGYHE